MVRNNLTTEQENKTMFAYNAGGVQDRSGEFLAQGANNAATLTMKSMENFGDDMGSMMASFANQYAENKAADAKGKAYGDFMKRHGDQLGFDPEWIKGFLSESPRQQAMIGDSIIGMNNTGRNLMSQQIVDRQMGGGGNRGAGGGGGGGGAFFTMPGA
jgi:hypothetical protein